MTSFPELDEFNSIEFRSILLKRITIREKYDSDGKWKMKLPDSEKVIAAAAPKRKRKPKSN